MNNILIFGASGAIGSAIAHQYSRNNCYLIYRGEKFSCKKQSSNITEYNLDLFNEEHLESLALKLANKNINRIINCIGTLHGQDYFPEKSILHLSTDSFIEIIKVNSLATGLIAKHCAPLFDKSTHNVFASLSARIGSITDNKLGGWYSYRASKAALNQIIKTLSIEFQRTHKNTAFIALHPGTTNSKLSSPFQKNVPSDKLFEPDYVASKLSNIIEHANGNDTGNFYAWDGTLIDW